MTTATNTRKTTDPVQEASDILTRLTDRRTQFEQGLHSTEQTLEELRKRRRHTFLDGADTALLDADITRQERNTADLESALEELAAQEAKADERHRAAMRKAAKIAEARARLKQVSLAVEMYDLIARAGEKAREAISALQAVQSESSQVAKLGGTRRTWSPLGGEEFLLQLAERLAAGEAPAAHQEAEELGQRLQELDADNHD